MAIIPTGKKIYLCTPDLKPITVLNGVDTESVSYSEHLRDYSTLSFTVDEYIVIDGKQVKSNGYDELDVYMNLYLEDIAFFQMQYPTVNNDGQKESKSITAYSIDKEWEDKDWVNFKCNTGEKDSLEQLVEDNLDDLGFTISFVKFYDPTRKDLSLLHIILEKMPSWSVDDLDIDHVLWDKKLSFSEDSINLYALMTSVIAPKAECVFLFDCLHRKIKAYHKDNLDFDTNIFIGFRNLSSQIDQTVNEDSVFTRFNVAGGNDLTINDWNYNDGRIINLNYFLREPYMTEAQANKFITWFAWQDAHREEFAGYSQTVSDLEDKIYTLKYMLPDDGTEISQWEGMNEEGLQESLKYYQSLLNAFEVSVDDNPTYTGSDGRTYHRNSKGDIVDENNRIIQPEITLTYNPWTTGGHVDYDRYLSLLYEMENGKSGYYTFYEIITYIIPNIEIAIQNQTAAPDEEEDFIRDFETNWELYGSVELDGKLQDYRNRLEALSEYAQPNPQGDEAYQQFHEEYVRITGYIGTASTPNTILYWIKQREDEIEEIGEEERIYNMLRMQMVANVNMYETEIIESESMDYGYDIVELDTLNPTWGFTEDDVKLYHILLHDTDYTNENILTTSLNTTSTVTSLETIIQKEKELLDDAKEKLSEISQPQITFSVTMDNIMQIPEFEELREDCSLLRFIRLGIRDDYSVKLRIVGRSWNPCEVNEDFNLEFSNMVTSSSGRSDLTDILNSEGGSTGKNSISIGSGNSDSDKEYAANLLSLMISTGLFSSAVSGVGGAGVDESQVNNLIKEYLLRNVINEASFNRIFATYIDVDTIVADTMRTMTISTDQITDSQGNTFADLVNSSINVDTITTSIIQGQDGQGNYYIDMITGALDMDTITANLIQGQDGNNNYYIDLISGALNMDTIATNLITGTNSNNQYYIDLLTGALNMNTIAANSGFINALVSQNAFISSMSSLAANTATATIDSAYITNIVAQNMTLSDLQVGDIVLSNQMRILSETNGTEGMIMSGSEIQFLDANGNPSISIGYNTISDGHGGTTVDYDYPSIIIKDSNGSIMLNSNGLSQNDVGIAPMIQNHSIGEGKLSFDFVKTQNGEIIVQNYDGSQNTWGLAITEFISDTNDSLEATIVDTDIYYAVGVSNSTAPVTGWATTSPQWEAGKYIWQKTITTYGDGTTEETSPVCIQAAQGQSNLRVEIQSSNGNIFKNDSIATTLTCKVYYGTTDVTNQASSFTWSKVDKNGNVDQNWNRATASNVINLTSADVEDRASFTCTVEIDI